MTALHMHLSQWAPNRCKICSWLLWIPLHHLRMWNTVLKCSAGNLSIHMFQEYSNHKTCCRTDCLDDIPDYSSSQPLLFWPVFDWAMAAHGALVVIGRQAEANRSLGAGEVHNLSKVLNFPSWRKRVNCRTPTVAQRSNSFFLEKTRLCWLASYHDYPWFSSLNHMCCCHMQHTLLATDHPRQPRLANSSNSWPSLGVMWGSGASWTHPAIGLYQETSKALTRTFLTTISSLRLMKHSVDNSPEMKWLLEKSMSQCEINCLVKVATNRRRANWTLVIWKLLWSFLLTEMIRVTFKWPMFSSLVSGLWAALDGKSRQR